MSKRQAKLVYRSPSGSHESFPFVDQIEIGRGRRGEASRPNRVVFHDPHISSRHCVISQSADGRFYVRDLSRNGTRVDGKRLLPNLEEEVKPDQVIAVGDYALTLWAEDASTLVPHTRDDSTILASGLQFVSILVGDIRGYTTLNQRADPKRVSRAVRNVFAELGARVERHGGILKEHQGDAIFAFWEEAPSQPGEYTRQALAAALALRDRTSELAADSRTWGFDEFPLEMDWAVTTGGVVISSFGKDRPIGLSMVGDVVNLAFRLEKLASGAPGRILTCSNTYQVARSSYAFHPLGEVEVKGRAGAEPVYVLDGHL